MKRLECLLLLLVKILFVNAEPSVHILAGNLDQTITSTTLEWVPSNGLENDQAILEYAVIAAYQSVEEPKVTDSESVEGQAEGSAISNKPVYVCRAKINSVWVSGQLRPKKHVCIVSLYKNVSEYKHFEILINIEGSARLSWVHKNKYTFISQGAVTSGENILRSFIARRPANSHNKEGSLTHIVGKFNPSDNLGVFYLVDQNNDELQFEDGEILVETEPIRYELKSIKFDRPRSRFPKKKKILGQVTLKNEEDGLMRVESAVGYNYTYSIFWGKGHGLLTGLPFKVFFSNASHFEGTWGIPKEENRVEMAFAKRYLEARTGVNVTIIGNYTESEVPYTATVVSIYNDEERREITIKDTKRENKMLDVAASFGPEFFLHNNSHVPTTTTTTTSTTTTTTTSKTTSTTQDDTPQALPEVVATQKKDIHSADNKHDNGSMLSDQQNSERDVSSLTEKNEVKQDPNGSSSTKVVGLVVVTVISLAIRRVT